MPADLCRAFALEKAKHMTVAQNRIHGLLTENFKDSYNVEKDISDSSYNHRYNVTENITFRIGILHIVRNIFIDSLISLILVTLYINFLLTLSVERKFFYKIF